MYGLSETYYADYVKNLQAPTRIKAAATDIHARSRRRSG